MRSSPVRAGVVVEFAIVNILEGLFEHGHLHLWWHTRRSNFELFVSQLVIDECLAGDAEAAEKRIALLSNLPLLDIDPEVIVLAQYLAQKVPLPKKAVADALHIATAVRHGIDYVLTWNCTHIANAELRPRIDRACTVQGYAPTILCTPEELIGGNSDD
jgi:predicted nucleic acid-binding protein